MKMWTLRHGAMIAAVVLAFVWSGCREGTTPEAAQEDAKGRVASEGGKRGSEQPKTRVPQTVTLPVGTSLHGRLETTISTDRSLAGDPVRVRTTEAVVVSEREVVPAGSTVHGTVTHVRAAGRMKGAAELTIRFAELELPSGARHPITCEPLRQVVKGDGKETAAEIGGGAAVGGILGGVLGGGDDALKGAAIGAAVGTGVAAATKGEQIVLPAGKSLALRLSAPITL